MQDSDGSFPGEVTGPQGDSLAVDQVEASFEPSEVGFSLTPIRTSSEVGFAMAEEWVKDTSPSLGKAGFPTDRPAARRAPRCARVCGKAGPFGLRSGGDEGRHT